MAHLKAVQQRVLPQKVIDLCCSMRGTNSADGKSASNGPAPFAQVQQAAVTRRRDVLPC